MTLLEPQAPDSLVAWGLFNTAFERKEYMEAYVAEDVAAQMLKNDPALRAEFEKRLSEDADVRARSERAARLLLSPPSRRGTSATTCIRCIGSTRRRDC